MLPAQRHGGADVGKADDTGANPCDRPRKAELPSLWNGSRRGGSIQPGAFTGSIAAELLSDQSPSIVAMEACATSHFWGRFVQHCGHNVRLIPPIHMKPFVKRQKNDAAVVAAIAEAAQRPNMHYVEVKSAEHQARAAAFRTHQCFVRHRTQLIDALPGHLGEFGIIVAQGPVDLTAGHSSR